MVDPTRAEPQGGAVAGRTPIQTVHADFPHTASQRSLRSRHLKILDFEPRSGWAIGQRLKQASNDALQVSDGSLYPALHKLEQQGWITAEWRATKNNRL